MSEAVTIEDIRAARTRIAPHVPISPALCNSVLDQRVNAKVVLKAECLQPTGSFKVRGAFSRLVAMNLEERARGIVAWSAGNHGQALAYAGAVLGVAATICMPTTASAIKIERTRTLGGHVVLVDPAITTREAEGLRIAKETGATIVPPYDDPFVIAGQGTLAMELCDDASRPLDVLLVCAGGGGLVSGCAVATAALSPTTRVIAVEPLGWNTVGRAWRGEPDLTSADRPATMADALATVVPGSLPTELARAHLADAVEVTENEMLDAVRFAWLELKLVLEVGGAAALAAVLSGRYHRPGERVGVVLSGGNIGAAEFAHIISPVS
jgi:threonine dehydratase